MSITAATILDEAASTLLDNAHRTWSADELLGFLNEAMRVTAGVKADFYSVQVFVTLQPGILQNLPDDGVALMDITRNEADGRVVTQVDQDLLNEASRFYPAGTQETTIEHYTADPRTPKQYTVFPPSNGLSSVEILYSAIPPQIMYAAEELSVSDAYQSALFNFVMSKAYQKNSKRQDLTKSSGYMAQWGQLLGLKGQGQTAVAPKVAASPGLT